MKLETLLNSQTTKQLLSYALIGTFAVIIDSIVYSLTRITLPFIPIGIANFFAMISGATFAFYMNRKYTFVTTDKMYKRLVIFIIVALFGYALSTGIILALVYLNLVEWIAKGFSIIVVAIVQFFINKYITFRKN